MASNKSFKFDKFDHKKPPSEMTKWDVIIDFVVFIAISAGYVIRVRTLLLKSLYLFIQNTLRNEAKTFKNISQKKSLRK